MGYVATVIVFYPLTVLIIALLWANLFRDGINSFKKRFVFWLKKISVRVGLPVIILLFTEFLKDYKLIDSDYQSTSYIIAILIHLLCYIAIWIFPEKVKSILYGSSNKFPKAKGASK